MFNTERLLDILTLSCKLQHATFPIVHVEYSYSRQLHIARSDRPLSTSLLSVLSTVCEYFYSHTDISSSHPTVELFLGHMREVSGLHLVNAIDLDAEVADNLAGDINDALYAFLREFKSKTHRKRIANLRRADRRNQSSIATYIDDLFTQHAKLLFIRLDIGYREAYYDQLTVTNVSDDLRCYLRSIQRRYTALVGYIWKMEYGEDRRFHFHLTFIFNGAVHQQDVSLGKALGEEWEAITDNQGNYYNCNSRRAQYQAWETDGIGMVHYAEITKQELLQKALSYLTKFDERILATLPASRRTFGRMEKPAPQSRGGRPRPQLLSQFD
ncbi:YagK/YfjJ domain-containing protein [Aeromonas salmonicida]